MKDRRKNIKKRTIGEHELTVAENGEKTRPFRPWSSYIGLADHLSAAERAPTSHASSAAEHEVRRPNL